MTLITIILRFVVQWFEKEIIFLLYTNTKENVSLKKLKGFVFRELGIQKIKAIMRSRKQRKLMVYPCKKKCSLTIQRSPFLSSYCLRLFLVEM